MYTSLHGNIIVKIIVIVKLDTMGLEPTTSTNTITVGKAHTITTKLS